jgi:hypothetical protein
MVDEYMPSPDHSREEHYANFRGTLRKLEYYADCKALSEIYRNAISLLGNTLLPMPEMVIHNIQAGVENVEARFNSHIPDSSKRLRRQYRKLLKARTVVD